MFMIYLWIAVIFGITHVVFLYQPLSAFFQHFRWQSDTPRFPYGEAPVFIAQYLFATIIELRLPITAATSTSRQSGAAVNQL